ncbi:MAG: transposase [Brachyspira sp.]|nr:transposase [Brachyspira sp.]
MTQEINFTPEKSKQIALARLDLIHKWLEFRKKSINKLQADYDFVKLHNTSNSHLFAILGKISRGSLHRWAAMLNGTEDYTKLLPQYKYSKVDEYRTVLTDEEVKIFMNLLLHPNRISIGKATALTKYKLKEQGQSFIPADITFRRYAKWFKDNNYDKWILVRDGEKALSDKVEPYIKRDVSLLEVGDILVADGHKLAFQVINPFTGKPCRATLVGFLDWKSTALVGYEIMLEENTQCIASALRNAIINLDMVPKVVYQDNGRAFRAKYFTDDKGFTELGFQGLYSKLGIETVFARPYNARAKVIERFFKEFQEGFEKLLPSYVGSSINNKPAYMMRNEKFHKNLHLDYIPTIEETIKMIDMWLSFKNSQPCPNVPDKTIAEVLESRKCQNIDINLLDDLMLKTEVKTIQRNGIRFLSCDYFDERLYGFKGKVLIKYNLFDLTSIKVFTTKGEYLCTAGRVTETHPMAKILGTVEDLEDYKQKIVKQRQLRKKTINSVKQYLSSEEIKFIEQNYPSPHPSPQRGEGANVQASFKQCSNHLQTLFKNNSEKYEYLIVHNPQDKWIEQFKQTKEYRLLYE